MISTECEVGDEDLIVNCRHVHLQYFWHCHIPSRQHRAFPSGSGVSRPLPVHMLHHDRPARSLLKFWEWYQAMIVSMTVGDICGGVNSKVWVIYVVVWVMWVELWVIGVGRLPRRKSAG